MSILNRIRDVIAQIIQDKDVRKPDLYCSQEIFQELIQRPDCALHPTQYDTVVMLPNVYWTVEETLVIPNIAPNTHKGELILQYLELVSRLIIEEDGSIDDVQEIVRDVLSQNK